VKPDGREGLTSFGNYPVIGLADARQKRLETKRMLAEGIDPIASKQQAKAEAVVRGHTFERVALDWHKEMSVKWAPGHSRTVLSRLKTHVFPLLGARAIVDLDTFDLMQPLETGLSSNRSRIRFNSGWTCSLHWIIQCASVCRGMSIPCRLRTLSKRYSGNSSELMAEYKETMSNWATDKADLEGKRKVLNTRLAETKSQSEKMIADARQAEEEAARAYAQAVAWSDVDGEKEAADDA